jgi:ribonuclease P/MRP protein subunit POP3
VQVSVNLSLSLSCRGENFTSIPFLVSNPSSLLQPLGDHRRTHVTPSKGKKRKRKLKQQPNTESQVDGSSETTELHNVPPPPPEIVSHILIGLNSVTRHLEALAAEHAPASLAQSRNGGKAEAVKSEDAGDVKEERSGNENGKLPKFPNTTPSHDPLALVIIPHAHPPSSLPHAHIPTLIHLSSPTSSNNSTRLITLPPTSQARLASALHIPHVGALAIKEGAPGARPLVEYVREHVGLTECAWIDEAKRGEWKATKIDDGK